MGKGSKDFGHIYIIFNSFRDLFTVFIIHFYIVLRFYCHCHYYYKYGEVVIVYSGHVMIILWMCGWRPTTSFF
jgi:hypothetical protein